MKKAFSILLSIFIGAALGIVISMLASSGSSDKNATETVVEIICMLLAVALAAYLQIILHEAGHLVCGLLTGYRFVSFRIGSLTLAKDIDGKLRFKRYKVAGTGGQCLMSPPDVPIEKLPTALYNAGGSLMNLLCAIVSLLLILYCDNMHFFVKYFLAATLAVGFVFALLNGIPMKLGGIANDAYNMLYLKRNRQSVKGFYSQLVVNEKLQNGTRLSQMPEDLFDLGGGIDYSDPMQANVALLSILRVLDAGDIAQAYSLLKNMNDLHMKELMALFRYEAKSDLLFASLVVGDTELAQSIINDKSVMDYITKYANVMTGKQRTLLAKAFVIDGDRDKAQRILDELVANHDSYLMQGEVASDIDLMTQFLDRESVDNNQVKNSN